jgi:integrase
MIRWPKTESGVRKLPLPSWAVEMLKRRHAIARAENRPAASPVFPDTLGGLRDPSNTRRALREARGSDGVRLGDLARVPQDGGHGVG